MNLLKMPRKKKFLDWRDSMRFRSQTKDICLVGDNFTIKDEYGNNRFIGKGPGLYLRK